ncbi:MAG: tetratricopeptide repeat protein [Lutibacter sp.]|uniref:tetratricopeptide repeat protein n=1 Tax=Lutibacter sp. TaxID=1925666 RepID=UPI00299CF24A|nr:tetratricopeptide repeat protein [Lutibacter sp.]MDX1830315.1 tetratricopeptide repeat protein [Lutibacter sp.]
MREILITLLLLITVLKTEAQSSVFTFVDNLLLQGNYKKALVLLDKQQPKTIELYNKTANIYETIGNYNKAIEYYKKALLIQEDSKIKVKLGNAYKSAGLISDAILIFEKIIKKDSSNLLVDNSLGKLYLMKNQPKKAEKIYRFLKKKDSLNPNYPYQLAKSLAKQHKNLAMGQSYLDAYDLDTLHFKSIYELAKFFKTLNYKDSTMLFIDKGLKIDSTNVNFIQLKATELYYSKEFKKSLNFLNRLDSLGFESVNTYQMVGMCYYNLKEYNLAEEYYKKALKLDRTNPKILYRLGTLYYEQKKPKLAKIYLFQSIMYGKGDLDKQYFLSGVIAREENNLKLALRLFEDSYKNNRDNYKALFQWAIVSDVFYKNKKIALKLYQNYFNQFKNKDKEITEYVVNRIKEIKKQYFIEGEIVD